jgi:hypothetical protein
MRETFIRSMARVGFILGFSLVASGQTTKSAGTLTIAGQADQVPMVRINGKSYVDIESLARITHGSVKYQGSQAILTLPAYTGATSSTVTTAQPARPPQLSEGFLAAEIEALAQIREWRVSIVNAVQNNFPVTEGWVGGLRRSAEAKLQLAIAAATTDPDQRVLELLRNEFTNMQQMSDQFLTMHAKVSYISPDAFDGNVLDKKILSCERALASMAATKQFQDEPTCH